MLLWEILKNINSSISIINLCIKVLSEENEAILRKIAEAHNISAVQALNSANRSNNKELELRVAIGHLRDSFNTYQVYLNNNKKGKIIIWDKKISQKEKQIVIMRIISLGLFITLIYKFVDDIENANEWKGITLDKFSDYKKAYLIQKRKECYLGSKKEYEIFDTPWGITTKERIVDSIYDEVKYQSFELNINKKQKELESQLTFS